MEVFSWNGRDDDGQKCTYQATHFGGWWQLEVAPKLGRAQRDDVEFETIEFEEDHWVELRDILWRKYQRRRVSWTLVEHIDDIIAGKAKNERRDRRPDETPAGKAQKERSHRSNIRRKKN